MLNHIFKLRFSELSPISLQSMVIIQEKGKMPEKWEQMSANPTESEQKEIQRIRSWLLSSDLEIINGTTFCQKAVYPLFLLAEKGNIKTRLRFLLKASYPRFEIGGNVDTLLGNGIAGAENRYFLVAEASQEPEKQNFPFQIYGKMLAAARLNWLQDKHHAEQEIFGCTIIQERWQFIQGIVQEFDADFPLMQVRFSREYFMKDEIEIIFRILKFIVIKNQ